MFKFVGRTVRKIQRNPKFQYFMEGLREFSGVLVMCVAFLLFIAGWACVAAFVG